jgi:sugar phosphate isomerase/epimerase
LTTTPVSGGHGAPDSVLSYLTVAGASVAESIAAAEEVGFGAVTLRAVPIGARPDQLDRVPLSMPESARSTRVRVADVEYVDIHPDLDVSRLRPVLAAGARVGAHFVNTMCTDPDEKRALGRLAELCRLAASYDLSVGLEFSSYTAVDSLEKAHRMVDRLRDPAAVVVVDALHLARTGGTPGDVAAFVRARPELYPVVHLCDAPRALPEPTVETLAYEARNERLLPGEGELPLEELVRAMPSATQYVEVPSPVLARRSFVERARAAADALARLRARAA